MINLLKCFLILICFNSCSQANKKSIENDSTELTIPLNWVQDQKIKFNETKYSRFLMYSKSYENPEFYEALLNTLRIPELDSFRIVSFDFQRFPSHYYQYKSGNLDKSRILEYSNEVLKDTILLNEKKTIHNELIALSGFRNGMQIIIPDLNYNKDFTDDIELSYPIEIKDIFTNDLNDKSKFDEINLHFQTIQNGKIYDSKRNVLIYPRANNKHIYLIDLGILDKSTNQYSIALELLDYAKAEISLNNKKYDIAIQGRSHENFVIVLKPENLIYEPDNQFLQQFITFELGDSITLGKDSFVFKELTSDFKTIRLEKIETHPNQEEDFSFENRFKNIAVNDFNNNSFDVLPSNKKIPKYTLVEFWGTWCAPCLELTPIIKDFNTKYNDIVDVVSIAFDDDIKGPQLYVERNNLHWKHGIVLRTEKANSIISKWNITIFPTLLLFDETNQFIYGGNSENALTKIDSIIQKAIPKDIDKFQVSNY